MLNSGILPFIDKLLNLMNFIVGKAVKMQAGNM